MTYNPRLVNQDNAQLLLSANNVTASTAEFNTLTCSGDFLVNNFTAYGRTNLSVTPNVAYIDYSEEIDKLLMFPGLYVTGTITASVGLSIGSTNGFQVNSAGNIIKLNGQTTNFPSNLGTNGSLLHTDGAGSLTWVNQNTLNVYSANRASNIIGGTAGKIPYQVGITNTEFIEVGTAGQVLTSNSSSAPTWVNQNTLNVNSSVTAGTSSLINIDYEVFPAVSDSYVPYLQYSSGPGKIFSNSNFRFYPNEARLFVSKITTAFISSSLDIDISSNDNLTLTSKNDSTFQTTVGKIDINSANLLNLQVGSGLSINLKSGATTAASFNSANTTFNVPAIFNSTVEIQQSSSLNSLTVKQLGSGYAVVVIDESGDDQSFFAIDSSGNVGIGISNFTPNTKLQVDGKTLLQANSAEPVLKITQTGTGNCLVVEDASSDTTPFIIDASGNVGIKTTNTNGYTLRVEGSARITQGVVIENDTYVALAASAGTTAVYTDLSGRLVDNSSDERIKKNINTIPDALQKVNNLRGVTFEWDNSRIQNFQIAEQLIGVKVVGLIAQEVEAVIPELTFTNSNNLKAVKYAETVALLIEAIKELSTENEQLKQKNNDFESRLSAIEAALANNT